MKFYSLETVKPEALRYTGEYNGAHKWTLPGVYCPTCHATWGGGPAYPGTDLSGLPEAKSLERAYLEEDFAEFERLRELVRPLVPPRAPLWPGTRFGPLAGTARGNFAQLTLQYGDSLLIRREALEQLQAEHLQGLEGYRTQLRFRQKQAPELLELQLMHHGRLHPACIPAEQRTPCARCGRWGFSLPKEPLLEAASLTGHPDIFQLDGFATLLVGSERFVDTVQRLGFAEVYFRELPLR
jgi:uncharacterized double-CXXCG motif protein